jgi:hypothetical protein
METGIQKPPKRLDQLRAELRTHPYSIRTEHAYLDWARRFILFHGKRHLKNMGPSEVAAFLSYLAVDRSISPSTQNQARSAILFLYKRVLKIDLPWLNAVVQAKHKARVRRFAPNEADF